MGRKIKATKEEKELAKSIDKQIYLDSQKLCNQYRILLLGSGQSGKSTFLKQIKLLYGNGFTPKEIEEFKDILRWNLQESIRQVCKASETLKVPFTSAPLIQQSKDMVQQLSDMSSTDIDFLTSPATVQFVKAMEQDSSYKAILKRSGEVSLLDATPFLITHYERLLSPTYIPTEEDILKARSQTRGVIETTLTIEGKEMVYIDVAGQKAERRKWLHLFDNVASVVFVAALSDYDQVMEEDAKTNRVVDAIDLFGQISNSEWFKKTSIALFLNKKDIFESKLPHSPLSQFFPEFKHGSDVGEALKFMKNMFLAKVKKSGSRSIFTHFTCATDTTSCKYVLSSINDTIINQGIAEMGLE